MAKVAMVVFSSYPRDPRVRREAEALADAGMSVDVICLGDQGLPTKEFVNGVQAYRINISRHRSGKLQYIMEYGSFLIAAFFKLSFLHLLKRYDVVHVHNLPDILVLSALIPKLTGAKVVLDMHEIMPEFFMRKYNKEEHHFSIRIIKLFEKISTRFSNHVIVATPFLKEKVLERSLSSDNCTAILNLSDSKYFKSIPTIDHRQNGKFKLVYPGTISEIQGLDVALNAVKLVVDNSEIPIEFHIYGHGSEEAEEKINNQIKDLNLQKVVKLNQGVPIERLAQILETMDVGIVPKRDGKFAGDAMSAKLFDFAAIGLPTIVSRTRGDSLYFDESMVLFFEPGNEKELANCIIKLYQTPKLRMTLSNNLKLLNQRLNWDVIKKDLYMVYDRLLLNSKNFKQNNR
jgi:glycosyltransferase involved in cell wall biosynthesis